MQFFYKPQKMNKLKFISTTLCCLLISGSIFAQGYLHRDNKKIVDGNGNEVLLRGMGLGGYMLQEGYLFQTSAFANSTLR